MCVCVCVCLHVYLWAFACGACVCACVFVCVYVCVYAPLIGLCKTYYINTTVLLLKCLFAYIFRNFLFDKLAHRNIHSL